MTKTKIRILGLLMILLGVLLASDTINIGNGFFNGALMGFLLIAGLFYSVSGKIKFPS